MSDYPVVYRNVDLVINALKNCENDDGLSEIQDLLQFYNNKPSTNEGVKKNPFIVFEGLDGSGKSTIMKVMNKQIDSKMFATPPECLKNLRPYFDSKSPEIRRAFYSLGNYIAAEQVKEMLSETTVLMDRFWHSTCAFALANHAPDVANLPPEDSDLYKWPEDLLKPDAVIFLDVPENVRIQRLSRRKNYTAEEDRLKNDEDFRNRLFTVFSRMREPNVTKIESVRPPKKVVAFLLNKLSNGGIQLHTK